MAGFTDFGMLQRRLLASVKGKVQNGELTERGLARMIGISQPHMHHILKGARGLSVETADRLLWRLGLSLLDLFEAEQCPTLEPHTTVGYYTKKRGFDLASSAEDWQLKSDKTGRTVV